MKFKKYNSLNSGNRSFSEQTSITFHKSGNITFSKNCADIIAIGQNVEFLQCEAEQEEWYLSLGAPDGFKVKTSQAGSFVIQNKYLVNAVIKSLGLEFSVDQKSYKIPLAKDIDPNTGAYPLITAALKSLRNEKV